MAKRPAKKTKPAKAPKPAAKGSLAIIGGCGHVGLPLGLMLADAGYSVTLVDTSRERVAQVRSGKMPFMERGAEPLLARALAAKRLHAVESLARAVARRGGTLDSRGAVEIVMGDVARAGHPFE